MNQDDTKRVIVKKFENRNKPTGAEDNQLVSGNGSGGQIDCRYFNLNSSVIF